MWKALLLNPQCWLLDIWTIRFAISRQDAFNPCKDSKRLWIFHNCCFLYCYSCGSFCHLHCSRPFCKIRAAKCAGVCISQWATKITESWSIITFTVKGRPHYYSSKKEEYAHIKFDLDAGKITVRNTLFQNWSINCIDFSSFFNWNTKQLFVYIVLATWPCSTIAFSTPPSQDVIWDTIINSRSQTHPLNPFHLLRALKKLSKTSSRSKQSLSTGTGDAPPLGIIHIKNSKPKYQITNINGKLFSQGNITLEVGWNVQPW